MYKKNKLLTKLTLVLFVFWIISSAYGQKVVVLESEEVIDGKSRKGLETVIELDLSIISKEWSKKVKEWGSVKSKSNTWIIENGNLPSVSSNPVKIWSKIESTKKGGKVWYAVEPISLNTGTDANQINLESTKKILHDFAIQLYLDDINSQIKDAEKVLQMAVKEQEKSIKRGESLKSSIQKNRAEKIKLEQKLVENSTEYKQLQSDSAANIEQQKAAELSVEKYKKAVESVREKLSKVE